MGIVGFRPAQVKAYLSMVAADPSEVERMEQFIQRHWLIQGPMQIPIQLDAFSFIWGGEGELSQTVRSMTTLYTAIEHKLWLKDIPRIRHGISAAKLENIRIWRKLETHVKEECEFLGLLAFTGLYNDMAEFSPCHRDQIYERLPSTNVDDRILESLSFLRALDSARPRETEYYFIHLTFQELFAARYFVSCLSEGKDLICITLGGSTKYEEMDRFIAREKYNGRFDVMWRFITGLLELQDQKGLARFIKTLDEPRDLLGLAHARLLMHCLAEITSLSLETDLQSFLVRTAHQLMRLLLFEAQANRIEPRSLLKARRAYSKGPSLGTSLEFPEWILQTMLERGKDKHRQIALKVLARRPQVSSTIFEQARSTLDGNDCDEIKAEAAFILGKNLHHSPEIITKAIQSETTLIRNMVSAGLREAPKLKRDILFAVLSQYRVDRLDGYREIIKNQSDSLLDTIDSIVSELHYSSFALQYCWPPTLKVQPQLGKGALESVAALLGDENSYVAVTSTLLLARDTKLPPSCIQALMSRLEGDIDRYWYSAHPLERQDVLPKEILDRIKILACDRAYPTFLWPVIQKHSAPSDEDLLAMFNRARNRDGMSAAITQSMFQRQEDPPEEILNHCVSLLLSGEYGHLAVDALTMNPNLPCEILDRLCLALKYPSMYMREVLKVISAQHIPPSQFLPAIKPHMEGLLSYDLLETLNKYPVVPDDILKSLISHAFRKYPVSSNDLSDLLNLPASRQRSLSSSGIRMTTELEVDCAYSIRRCPKFYPILEKLDTEYWVFWLRILFEWSFKEGVICYIQDDHLWLELPEGSFKLNIGRPGQREKLDAALDSIHNEVEGSLDDFHLLELSPEEHNVLS
ncbi:uncharacterized protein BO80DRAFT_502789 [Aspergillus ibericus CBS 121593]|uniref:DUF7068 domain-containing protein n=1 Tax=Aspergillus ibericus CBS 121593 TaxID=1448316 RepID=A0A395GX51_9EURO|nr:hypothetical protein BO80DRAFT_502789 [Aspergillus ibericus CBS 121593]RAL00172.1 hypothetical protein BO80DRAFT_502789 [Aspergillus ibericus CBS 121593]